MTYMESKIEVSPWDVVGKSEGLFQYTCMHNNNAHT